MDEDALSQVIAKNVEDLTDADITALISALRSERVALLAAEASKTRAPTSAITKASKKASTPLLSFDDLGI